MNKKWFTLIELSVSMLIVSLVIFWVSTSLIKLSNNITDNNLKTEIFTQLKEFNYDSYLFNYNSWKILSGGLLLYWNNWWILIGSFSDENNWYNYKYNTWFTNYSKKYFWYFKVKTNVFSWILNDSINYSTTFFNDWKIFNKVLVKDIKLSSYNTWWVFELNLDIIKKYNSQNDWQKISDIFLSKDEILKINYNF